MAIDFTNKETLITIKVALIRALNSLDNEIEPHKRWINAFEFSGHIKQNATNRKTADQHKAKLALLLKSRADMTALYNGIDDAINAAH